MESFIRQILRKFSNDKELDMLGEKKMSSITIKNTILLKIYVVTT